MEATLTWVTTELFLARNVGIFVVGIEDSRYAVLIPVENHALSRIKIRVEEEFRQICWADLPRIVETRNCGTFLTGLTGVGPKRNQIQANLAIRPWIRCWHRSVNPHKVGRTIVRVVGV